MSINISTPLKDKRILEEGLFPWSLHRDLLLSFNANSADIEDGELTLTRKRIGLIMKKNSKSTICLGVSESERKKRKESNRFSTKINF